MANTSPCVWTLMNLSAQEIQDRFPQTRRFFEMGFMLDKKNHGDGVVGLISQFQTLKFNLETGDFQ